MNQSAEKITDLKTALYNFHIAHGGKMVPFAGYQMPVQYPEGIMKEHLHVRSAAGIFDVSHMGQFSIYGTEEEYLPLEKIVPIDLKTLKLNQSKYTVLMNKDGGIDDDLIVTKVEGGLNIVLNAACKHHDIKRIHEVIDSSKTKLHDDLSLIAIQGPKAVEILDGLIPGVSALTFMNGSKYQFNNENVYVTRSGYTGEDGFEVSIKNLIVQNFCKILLENKNVKLIGLGGSAPAIKGIKDGSWFAGVFGAPGTEGRLAMEAMVDALNNGVDQGGIDPLSSIPDEGLMTADNISKFTAEWDG